MGRLDREARRQAPTLTLPAPLALCARPCIDLQMQCWGKNAVAPGGNLLIRAGMARRPRPEGSDGTSGYLLDLPEQRVMIWGFGFASGLCGGPDVFFARYEFLARWLPSFDAVIDQWNPSALQRLPGPPLDSGSTVRALLISGLEWIANYERWVADCLGPEYRIGVLESVNRPADSKMPMADAWDGIAAQARRWVP